MPRPSIKRFWKHLKPETISKLVEQTDGDRGREHQFHAVVFLKKILVVDLDYRYKRKIGRQRRLAIFVPIGKAEAITKSHVPVVAEFRGEQVPCQAGYPRLVVKGILKGTEKKILILKTDELIIPLVFFPA